MVPHDRADTPTPPAVDLSMSPSSRHTPSSPEMPNGNYIPSGVSEARSHRTHVRTSVSHFLFIDPQPQVWQKEPTLPSSPVACSLKKKKEKKQTKKKRVTQPLGVSRSGAAGSGRVCASAGESDYAQGVRALEGLQELLSSASCASPTSVSVCRDVHPVAPAGCMCAASVRLIRFSDEVQPRRPHAA